MRRIAIFLVLLITSVAAMERQSNADYRARREALVAKVKAPVLLFAPTESEGPNAIYGFRQEDNFYYLTGLEEPGAGLYLFPGADGKSYSEILLLPGRNISQEKWTGPKLTGDSSDAKQRTGFDRVLPLDALRDELVRTLPAPRVTVYADTDLKSASAEPLDWLRRANAFPNYATFVDVIPALAELRLLKDKGEQELLRKASEASVAAHMAVLKAMKSAKYEQEISALMQYEFLRRGCERPAYAPIVGSGYYSTVLHYSKNSNSIKPGDLVVMDVAGEYSMYASDITRTLPANGKFTTRQREIYEIVLGAHDAAIKAFRAGVSTLRGDNSLHQVAVDYIKAHGKDKHGKSLEDYFIHSLSHYVGLNVHDPGDTRTALKPGMVFTIEPGIYIPEENLGVRIEDIFLVGDDGKLINLSGKIPTNPDEIERAMAAQ